MKLNFIERQHLYEDFSKSFLNTVYVQQPNILIFDFYADINFGFVKLGDSYITNKLFKYKAVPYIANSNFAEAYSGRRSFDVFFPIWEKSVEQFMEFCHNYLPNTVIILNKPRMATYYFDRVNREIKLINENHSVEMIDKINERWDECDNYFEKKYDIFTIDYEGKKYYGNPYHIWNLDYLHFEDNYYSDFLWKVLEICIEAGVQCGKSAIKGKNILQNSNFIYGTSSWKTGNKEWQIVKNPLEGQYLEIDIKNCEVAKNRQIWSQEMEINAKGEEEYTIKFDIYSENWSGVDDSGIFLSIRTFDEREKTDKKDSVQNISLCKNDFCMKDGEWNQVVYSFIPTGRFIRIAPYLQKNGMLRYKKISLYESDGEIHEWKPCINEIYKLT